MKISGLELFKVPPRWLFVKVSTDEGVSGWGEPIVEGRAETVRAAVEEMSGYLVGTDPFRIEDHFQVLYRGGFYRGGPILTSALSGIEQALWDVKGRALGVPVYELLGGAARERVRVYSWIHGDHPSALVDSARARMAEDFTAVKMNATVQTHYVDSHARIDEAAARLAAVREAVGPGLDVAVDFHGRVHKSMARALVRELEAYGPLFFEEPVPPENDEALREISRHTTVPIAAGERMYTRWGFKRVLAGGSVDIVQPDLSHAGGILEVRKISSMAEAFDVAVAPHCPLGPIALAASLQLDACTPNAFIQEQSLEIQRDSSNDLLDYLEDPGVFAYGEGYVPIPGGAGLGIEVDEERVREASKVGHDWRAPVWRNPDGTVAEW